MGRLSATMGVLFWTLAISSAAQADGGRISFVGSIVTPTCGPAMVAPSSAVSQDLRGRCPDTSAPVRYSLRAEPSSIALPGSQVLAYHDQYLRQVGASSTLLTQVYD